MRLIRVRLWSLMAAIALVALALAGLVQTYGARQALIRQEQLRAEAAAERAKSALATINARPEEPRQTTSDAIGP
jgi:hypothetical protein